ncbi:DUF2797 domain-containing protein [Gallaecimonas kandeliae]|uniref:DUF2797 domain-containing protein n=1 Tax=Gallaecimonas kandeliae TaxID=3029055 RepID=UPI002647FBF8|nr:DUF2797 domain-containing protein [Gallaecimonas kandeliae]WKE67275.1 DUF2797 domain-containing protein [Gallaecimonas kandeliae]
MLGTLDKMRTRQGDEVAYQLVVGEQLLDLNPLIGKPISLAFTGNIYCCHCGRKTKKSFSQGYCFPCMKKLAQCDMCILKPETCHLHLGTCREPDWGESHCMIPHLVYLANTSGLKVGITRQAPTRWMDQGASQALPIIKVATRRIAGLVEVALADFINDKTDWRALLKGEAEPLDLKAEAARLLPQISQSLDGLKLQFGTDAWELLDESVLEFNYPVRQYPAKLSALNLDKTTAIDGTLLGIKGQYLILDCGVLNVRKFSSYEVEVLA